MTGHSKLTKESTEEKGPNGRLREGLMYSDGSELREDGPEACAVVAYLKLITDTLAGDKYNSYLKVMADFQAGRIDLEGVENHLMDVFHGHPDLILGLKRLLPNDIEIILPAESDQPEQLKSKMQVSKENCKKKTKRERLEHNNEGPQIADDGDDEEADLPQKIKRGKGRHENDSHQAAESASYKTVERLPSTSQNVEEWHEVELRMYQLEGRHQTANSVHMWPAVPITAANFLPTNEMPALHSTQETSPRTNAAKDGHVNKGISLTPTKRLLQDMKMPSLIMDTHEKLRSFSQCLNQNTLVEDPVSHEQKRKTRNLWTAEEKQLFIEKFKVFKKLFSKIASFLENKTTADCVEYYYLNKKSGDLEMVRRRQKRKRNGERGA